MRKLINGSLWEFIGQDVGNSIDKTYNDENWECVNIHHTWNAVDYVYPRMADFTFYAGIYRHVNFVLLTKFTLI